MDRPAVTILKSQLDRKGGLEKYTWEIAKTFCQYGSKVTLLTSGDVKAPFASGHLEIVSFPIDTLFSYLNVQRFDQACQRFLKDRPTPIVFGLDRNSEQSHIRAGNGVHAAYLRHRAKIEGGLKALSFKINPLHHSLLAIEKKSFESRKLRTLFTNSHMVKNEVLELYNTPPEKIEVVHNGVEWCQMLADFEQWQEKREELIAELSLDPQAYQLLFIGHNYQRKGLENLLKGMSLIKTTPLQLCIIGKEKKIGYFKQMAQQLGLEKSVRFLGQRSDIRRFYQMADALAIPSSYDPFANVTVEALAMGLYVISSKTNGGHEVLQPYSGTTIDNLDDPHSVALAIQRAVGTFKSVSSSTQIRTSVKHLDFPNQLNRIIQATYTETLSR
ncbi:MAG: glycosyltransferase family 4 protein [Verrucomicrobia bacterium]|nr:glycosyltransferase family 4 protein [Verrucomicrobiota bacterium]